MPRRIPNSLMTFLKSCQANAAGRIRPARLFFRRMQFPAPFFARFPIFAARQLDASRITELLLWIFAFIAYVILGVVILMRISRSLKEGRTQSSYEGDADLFRELYRKNLISAKEYKTIQTRLRDQLVNDVLNRTPAESPSKNAFSTELDETEKLLRLRALLQEAPPRRR